MKNKKAILFYSLAALCMLANFLVQGALLFSGLGLLFLFLGISQYDKNHKSQDTTDNTEKNGKLAWVVLVVMFLILGGLAYYYFF